MESSTETIKVVVKKEKMTVTAYDDDDNDSSFFRATPNDSSFNKRKSLESTDLTSSPIICQKKFPHSANKMIKVKPVVSIHNKSLQTNLSKTSIDKIADNLKIMQQIRSTSLKNTSNTTPPKVSVVKSNSTNITKHETTKPIDLKETTTKSQDQEEMSDNDLTNLDWLNTFSLNIKPLSPPQSPPLPPAQYDESDGGPVLVIKQPVGSTFIRPWVAMQKHKLNQTYPSSSGGSRNNPIEQYPKVKINQNLANLFLNNRSFANVIQSPKRPPYSFSCLTYLAIEASERKRLSVKDIYSWIIQNFPYYRNVPSGSWKNSIRHNLTYNQCFSKVDKNLLAMRDFSGKGSLWCISPELRPLLAEAFKQNVLNKNNLAPHELIPFLQDVTESPKTTSTSNCSVSINRSLVHLKTNKKRFSIENAKPAILNPKLVSRITPVVSSASKINKSTSNLSIQSDRDAVASISIGTEMDAVNALLSMKSRSSSMPLHFNLPTTSAAVAIEDLDSSNRRGRRKQLFKTPTKRKSEAIEEEEHSSQPNVVSNFDEDDDYNTFDLNVSEEEEDLDELGDQSENNFSANKKCKQFHHNENNENLGESSVTKKSPRKLLVKFPCFKLKRCPPTQEKAVDYSDSDSSSDQLKIDESVDVESTDDIKLLNQHLNKGKKIDADEKPTSCSKIIDELNDLETCSTKSPESTDSNKNSLHNALLELSRAACLVEERKVQPTDESTTNNSINKCKKFKPNELNLQSNNKSSISTRSKTINPNLIVTRSKKSTFDTVKQATSSKHHLFLRKKTN